MLGWLKSKKEKQADRTVALLDRAIREVHPDRFVDPLDAALVAQPRLALLNSLLGKEKPENFSPVAFNDLVSQFSFFEQRGVLDKAVAVIGDDPVLMALSVAAMHERHNPVKRADVRQLAEQLLQCLNQANEM